MVTKIYSPYGRLFVMLILFLSSLAVTAQTRQVSGQVTGEGNDPLVGASVVVKGTSTGSITDIDGKFSIAVSGDNAVLVVSYVGYKNQEIAVGSQSTASVQLETSTLEEVVVTGYSSQSRKDISGSVAVIDTKDMKKFGGSNIAEQLQGKVAGVQIGSSGDPGSVAFVRIRGFGTINQNEPLYVIDGVQVQNETSLNFLNPGDIESIQVLKDASAASIYGSRAANGVIVITTKKGKAGNSKITFDVYRGSQTAPNQAFPVLANPQELLEINKGLAAGAGKNFENKLYPVVGGQPVLPDFIMRGGGLNGGFLSGSTEVDPSKYFLTSDVTASSDVNYLIQQANKTGTDWMRELINSGQITNYQVGANGGSEKGTYYFSANYFDNDGILIENNYRRYQMRANSSFNVKKNVKVGQNLNIAYQTGRGGIGNPSEGSPFINALRMPQIVPLTDIKGNPGGAYGTSSNAGNPIAAQQRSRDNPGHSLRVTGSVFADIDFLKNFTYSTRFGIDYNTGQFEGYGFRNFEATEVNSANSFSRNTFNNRNWLFYNTLRYSKEITTDIKLDALVGVESKDNYYDGFNARGGKLLFGNDPNYRVLGNADGKTVNAGSYKGSFATFSQFGQVNLNFLDKYLVTGVVRRDGVSRFLTNRYGIFPAGSVAWKISKESFMQDLTAVSDLKLRASYGETGNNEVDDYAGFTTFFSGIGTTAYDITGSGNSVLPGFAQGSIGNPDLKWESTSMLNFGLDFTLWKKLDVVFEWYNRKTSQMLYGVELPTTQYPGKTQDQNIGAMQNKGIDLQLNYKGSTSNKDLNYTIGVTYTQYTNTLVNLDANENTFLRSAGSRIGDISKSEAGLPLSQFYGYVHQGVWQSQAEIDAALTDKGDAKVGRFKFQDVNGDKKIDAKDEVYIGSPHPDFMYGVNIGLNYKNFDFTMFVQGVQGNKIFNFVKYFTDFPAFQANYSRAMLTEAGKTLPKLDGDDNYSSARSSYYVEDGSFLRGRNFQLGYTLPVSSLTKFGLEKLRLYVSAQNLFTVTKYSGFDPDITAANNQEGFARRRDIALGVDYGRYPTPRTIIVGLNVEF
jgi:TonB-dependent starch-binding outer membrane protein SusC